MEKVVNGGGVDEKTTETFFLFENFLSIKNTKLFAGSD
jgi:hypothetical protein